jgi:PhnB protein
MHPTPYLFFEGDCLEAMTFYAETLGGTVEGVVRNSDAARPEDRMPGPDDAVMNMVLRTDGGTIMASDAPAEWHSKPQGFRLHLEAGSSEEFDRLHAALGRDARYRHARGRDPLGRAFRHVHRPVRHALDAELNRNERLTHDRCDHRRDPRARLLRGRVGRLHLARGDHAVELGEP